MRKVGFGQSMTFPHIKKKSKASQFLGSMGFNTKVSLEKLQKFALTSLDLP